MSRRFKPGPDRGVRVTLAEREVEFLRALPEQLRPLYESAGPPVAGQTGDPVRERLFPRAYLDPTAEDAEAEWRELVHPDLVRERLEALARLSASLESPITRRRGALGVDLTEDEVAAWMGVLNDARLVLGIRLEITEDLAELPLDPTDERYEGFAAYAWLTEVQADLVETQLRHLPG